MKTLDTKLMQEFLNKKKKKKQNKKYKVNKGIGGSILGTRG